MAKPINIPNTFASATSAIPLSQLDQDFSTLANATNDLATYSNYVADTGAADAYIANYPANTNTGSLTTGLRLQFKAANANTGASTLNVQVNGGSIGTAAIRLTDGSALPANTIIAGALVDVMYDGTNFQIMNDPSGGQEIITNLTLSGNLTVAGTSTFTGNVTGNVVNTTTSTITNLTSSNVTITGGTISNVTLDNVTVDVETFSNITINGTASFAAGSNTAPSITFTGDTNTGIYSPAADTIAFTEGGVEAMRIDSSGNVGIGTSSPSNRLEVSNSRNGNTVDVVVANTYYLAGSTDELVSFQGEFYQNDVAANRAAGYMRFGKSGDFSNNANASAFLSFATRNAGTVAERMRITSAGLVGIGNSSPTYQLDVLTSGNNGIRVAAGTSSADQLYMGNTGGLPAFGTLTNQVVRFITNGTERARIDTSGNVGIGTSSPGYSLEISSGSTDATALFNSTSVNGSHIRIASSGTVKNYIGCAAGFVTSGSADDLGLRAVGKISFATNGAAADMTLDTSGNLGLGVTPSAWNTGVKAIQITSALSMFGNGTNNAVIGNNWFLNTSDQYIYNNSLAASRYSQNAGAHSWHIAPSGTAGNAITFTQAMTLDASGNLGIGTTSPAYRLDVTAPASNNGVIALRAGANLASYVSVAGNNSTPLSSSFDLIQDQSLAYVYQRANLPMVFGTNNTERMRIDSNGKIGVNGTPQTGVSAQVEVLQVLGTDGATSTMAVKRYSADTGSPNLRSYKSRAASIGTDTIVQSGDGVGAWTGYGYDGSAYINCAQVLMSVDGTPGTNDMPGRLVFSTTPDGSNVLTERMRIDSSGNVGIGTSSPVFASGGGLSVYNAGAARIKLGDSTSGIGSLDGFELIYDDDAYVFNRENTAIIFGTNGAERMRITSSGNVLINRTTVAGAGNVGLIISGDADTTDTNYTFYAVYSNGAQVFGLKNSGYIRADGVYNKTSATSANVNVDSAGNLTRATSALKYKTDVRNLESIDINKFRAVRYKSKCEIDDPTLDHFGIVADEVDQAGIKELVTYGATGEVEGFQYERLTVVLLKAIQEQQAMIETLQAEVALLKSK